MRQSFKPLLDKVAGALTVGLLGAIKHTDRRRMAKTAIFSWSRSASRS